MEELTIKSLEDISKNKSRQDMRVYLNSRLTHYRELRAKLNSAVAMCHYLHNVEIQKEARAEFNKLFRKAIDNEKTLKYFRDVLMKNIE